MAVQISRKNLGLAIALTFTVQVLTWFGLYPLAGYNHTTLLVSQVVFLTIGFGLVFLNRFSWQQMGADGTRFLLALAGILVAYGALLVVLVGLRALGIEMQIFRSEYQLWALGNNWLLTGCGEELFFAGILFTGVTSGCYHVWPGNNTLFWDRLAMAISFMAFLTIVIGAFISNRWSRRLLLPLVGFGVFSVAYWIVTEQHGAGDLRLYVLTQFFTPLVIAAIILSMSSETITTRDIIIIGIGYGFAKLCELNDGHLYQVIGFSGHSLKHLAAAFSAYWVVHIFKNHREHNENQSICYE